MYVRSGVFERAVSKILACKAKLAVQCLPFLLGATCSLASRK